MQQGRAPPSQHRAAATGMHDRKQFPGTGRGTVEYSNAWQPRSLQTLLVVLIQFSWSMALTENLSEMGL